MADDDAAAIEANAAWGSGIYGCDPARILPVLRRAMVRRDALTPNDMRWVIGRDAEQVRPLGIWHGGNSVGKVPAIV